MTDEEERTLIDETIALLANFPANGKPPNTDATLYAVRLGFIERREINKPC